MISIISLIYKSPSYADAVYNSIHKYTPMIKAGKAEFFFVANDPTDKLLKHLKFQNYPYILNINPEETEEELQLKNIGKPTYISRVYKGWNCAIKNSEEITVLVNSDNLFSPDWLENLYKNLNENVIVCSQLVERKHEKYNVFPGAFHKEFGKTPSTFNENAFLNFSKQIRKNTVKSGGAYMPCMFYKKNVEKVNYYPEGNPIVKRRTVSGDKYMFQKLNNNGIKHITALDSIVYHFKEGEMDE